MTTRIVLADDQALLRATFALLINSTEDLQVVGEAATGTEAVDIVGHARPDIVLMDIRMPDMDGIAATSAITADPDLGDVRIIILTTFEIDELILAALRAGASGFIGKGVDPTALLDAIRVVAAGDALLSPAATATVIAQVLAQPRSSQAAASSLAALTPRETEILSLVGLGLSNAEIAERLVISPVTAKTHVNRAMVKLHARDRAQLVIAAYENGLVVTGRPRPMP